MFERCPLEGFSLRPLSFIHGTFTVPDGEHSVHLCIGMVLVCRMKNIHRNVLLIARVDTRCVIADCKEHNVVVRSAGREWRES